jgi:hypothetical protein
VLFVEFILTAAHVHDQREAQRQIGGASEKTNFLRDSVFEDFNIVLCKIAGERAASIAYDESNVDQAHIYLDGERRRFLCENGGGEQKKERTHRHNYVWNRV